MAAAAVVSPGFDRLARFKLLRELGRGAQATVMLAHDPRLDREVALKLLSADADAVAVSEWLDEARAVSRLAHPHIVPVFEADEFEGQPYLVFEYVPGPTLLQARRGKGALAARDAVQLMLGVLDALAAAHEQGVVHRDLKPSNVLMGSDGRARVMDFGIAARIGQADGRPGAGNGAGRVVGTPGYMSPEAARGEPPQPQMDVFAAGMMLGELLAGAPLMRESDPWRYVARVQAEDLVLPAGVKVDSALRGVVQRALARNTAERFDSARSLHRALTAWLTPETGEAPALQPGSPATLQFLLRRMRHKTDFPALSASVVRIQRVATSETESLQSLADEILKDVALTNKLLRMVNTAHFTAVAGEGVATVSRAVALVGFAGIRNMALSVVLLEHMGDKAHAAQLKEEFLRALMAGTLAEELSTLAKEGEEAFLGALFQNLGRLLTECYLPEEALQVRQRLASGGDVDGAAAGPAAREAAARAVLGLAFSELGLGVAKAWGLPDNLQRALQMPLGEVPVKAVDPRAEGGSQRLRWLGRSANALADALLGSDGEAQTKALAAAAACYAPALGLTPAALVSAAQASRTRLTQLAQAMGLQVAANAPARRLLLGSTAHLASPAGPARLATTADAPTLVVAPVDRADAQTQLTAALAAVRANGRGGKRPAGEVLRTVLQALQGALAFDRVVFCLREPASGQLVGRLALGPGAEAVKAAFRFTPDAAAVADLFAWLGARGADLLISDSTSVAARLPAWYHRFVGAPTFLLLPVMVKGAPLGMIYADKATAGSIVLDEKDLGLLRALRDEVAAAFGAAPR